MGDIMEFADRKEFRQWLSDHCLSSAGVWLLFGKPGGPKTIKASDALEEALCFGWIDGQMQSLDDKAYKKYFSLRRENSKWSEKNKTLVKSLEEQGLMTDWGRRKIEDAKKKRTMGRSQISRGDRGADIFVIWLTKNVPARI